MKKIYVTEPALPDLEEFIPYLENIWESRRLTNNGPFHEKFEKELASYLNVDYISVFANGTLALITALQALRISGEVITTPYSFVATTHALWWNKLKPVFADIEPTFCTLDASKIEAAITPRTTAIVPVHTYGNPCAVEQIQAIADTYGLKVIYDAAHAFGVQSNGTSILQQGDMSILSFHATKIFNTLEGGAIVCHDKKTKQRIDYMKNFGFAGETKVVLPGINAKMNEIQAALGLLQLKEMDKILAQRKRITNQYRQALQNVNGIRSLEEVKGVKHNYSYFPIFIDTKSDETSRDALYDLLKKNNIFARRYFYPLISHFQIYSGLESASRSNLPVSERTANEVLCLPIYPTLTESEVTKICDLIKGFLD